MAYLTSAQLSDLSDLIEALNEVCANTDSDGVISLGVGKVRVRAGDEDDFTLGDIVHVNGTGWEFHPND